MCIYICIHIVYHNMIMRHITIVCVDEWWNKVYVIPYPLIIILILLILNKISNPYLDTIIRHYLILRYFVLLQRCIDIKDHATCWRYMRNSKWVNTCWSPTSTCEKRIIHKDMYFLLRCIVAHKMFFSSYNKCLPPTTHCANTVFFYVAIFCSALWWYWMKRK